MHESFSFLLKSQSQWTGYVKNKKKRNYYTLFSNSYTFFKLISKMVYFWCTFGVKLIVQHSRKPLFKAFIHTESLFVLHMREQQYFTDRIAVR